MGNKGEQRKREIIAGLQVVMAEVGYERASIGAIGKAAGLTPGLVHYHFRSKQAVLLALVEQLSGTLQARFETRDLPGLSALQRLDALIDALVGLGEDADPNAAACWAQIGSEAQRQPEVRALFETACIEARTVLVRLLTDCGAADPETAATAVLCTIEGAYRLGVGAPSTLPAGSAVHIVQQVARGWLP